MSLVDLFPAEETVQGGHSHKYVMLHEIPFNPLRAKLSLTVSHLEDGKHYAAEGSVIRELCHVKDIKAPLVQVIQFLRGQDKQH